MLKKVTILSLIVAFLVITVLGCSRTTEDKLTKAQKVLFEEGKVTEAKKLFDEIAKESPNLPIGGYSTALMDEYKGFEQEALPEYLEAAKAGEGFWPAMDGYTRLAIDLDYLNNARMMAYIMAKRQPNNPLPHQYLAQIYMRWEVFDSATAHMQKADSLGNGDVNRMLLGAEADFRSNDSTNSEQALTRFQKMRKASVDQLIWAARLFDYVSMTDSAIAYMRKAVELEPHNVKARLQLAQYLYDGLYLAEAHEIVQNILKETEQCGPAYILSAKIWTALNKDNEGEQAFMKYSALRENSAYALEKHGAFAASKKQEAAVMTDYETGYILSINLQYPDDYIYRLLVKMQNTFLEYSEMSLAVPYVKDGDQLAPDSLEIDFIKKELASRMGEAREKDSVTRVMDQEWPKNISYRKWLELAGKFYNRTRRPEKALVVYRRLLNLPKCRLDYFFAMINLLTPTRDVTAVDSLVKLIPFRFEENRPLREALYTFYASAGQEEKSGRYAEWLYHHSPNYLPYIAMLAKHYVAWNKVQDARALYAGYIKLFPEDPAGYYERSRFELEYGSVDSVMNGANKALAIDIAYWPALELKGEFFAKAGQADSAAAYFRRVVKLESPSPLAYYFLADYLCQRGDSLNRAAGLAMIAMRYFGRDPRGLMLLGKIYYKQGKYQLALTQFQTGADTFTDNAEFPFLAGKALIGLNKKAEGKKELQKALKLNLETSMRTEAEALLRSL